MQEVLAALVVDEPLPVRGSTGTLARRRPAASRLHWPRAWPPRWGPPPLALHLSTGPSTRCTACTRELRPAAGPAPAKRSGAAKAVRWKGRGGNRHGEVALEVGLGARGGAPDWTRAADGSTRFSDHGARRSALEDTAPRPAHDRAKRSLPQRLDPARRVGRTGRRARSTAGSTRCCFGRPLNEIAVTACTSRFPFPPPAGVRRGCERAAASSPDRAPSSAAAPGSPRLPDHSRGKPCGTTSRWLRTPRRPACLGASFARRSGARVRSSPRCWRRPCAGKVRGAGTRARRRGTPGRLAAPGPIASVPAARSRACGESGRRAPRAAASPVGGTTPGPPASARERLPLRRAASW